MKINEFTEGSNPLFKINKFLDDKKKREEYARKLQQQRDAEDKEKVEEDFSSIPPLTDLIVMAVVGQTTVAALKAAFKAGKYALKLKRLADKAGVKLNQAVYGEAVNRDEYAAKLAAQSQDKFMSAALAALDRLVKSDPRGQDVGGYAFDIARAFQGVNGRELAAAYSARK